MRYGLLCLLLVLLGCTKEKGGGQWLYQREKWMSMGFSSYSYTFKRYCFCTPEGVGPFQIVVLQGKIVTVNGQPYDSGGTNQLFTIDQLFESVDQYLDSRPYYSRVIYNNQYGFPEDVYIDFNKDVADEESGFQVSGFYPLR
ncbi:MAG: DUF6174 domain-containing protein [Chitinophagaceae bacterium]